MDVEILLHGVPSGQDYYGIKEEQNLADSFYHNTNESVKLVVEVRKKGNIPYVYYTYLRYKNIVGAGGRSGSYIGITLRLDMYYLDVVHMYNMLEMAFKKCVIGALLIPTGESYKYISPDFSSKKSEIEQLQQGILKLIETTCVFTKFAKIDNSFINPITNTPTCNISDITEEAMSATLKKYSKIILSPCYKSNLEKEYEKKVQDVEGRGGSIVAEKDKQLLEKDKTIAQKDTTITNLNATISTRDTEIGTLKQEIKRRDQELAQNKQKVEISQLINKVKEPIIALSEYFYTKDSVHRAPTPKFGKKNFYIGIVNIVLGTIVIAMLFMSLLKPIKYANTSDELNNLGSQYETLVGKYSKLETEYNHLNNQYQSVLKNNSDNKKHKDKNVEKISQAKTKKKAKADVETKMNVVSDAKVTQSTPLELKYNMNPKENELEVNKEYTFSIEGYHGTGIWKMDGLESVSSDRKSTKIVVKGKVNADKAVLSYTPDDTNYSKLSLTFKYKHDE